MFKTKKKNNYILYFLGISYFAILIEVLFSGIAFQSVGGIINDISSNLISDNVHDNSIVSSLNADGLTFSGIKIYSGSGSSNYVGLNYSQNKALQSTAYIAPSSNEPSGVVGIEIIPASFFGQSVNTTSHQSSRPVGGNSSDLGSVTNLKGLLSGLFNKKKSGSEESMYKPAELEASIGFTNGIPFGMTDITGRQEIGIAPSGDPEDNQIPVGDGWVFLLLLAVSYGCWQKRMRVSKC